MYTSYCIHVLHIFCLFFSVEPFSPISPKTVSLKLASLPSPVQATPTGSKSTPTLSKSASVASKSVSSPALPQKQVKIKTTRSKAWLEGYRASDDPIRIFYADVYSYHDAGGEYIAQPFIEMPSRKVHVMNGVGFNCM